MISQQIWNKISIALAILGTCIMIEKFSVGKWSMYIHLSGWHTFDFSASTSLAVSRWHGWCSGPRWHCFLWRCTHAFVPPASLRMYFCAVLARKAAIHSIFTNHCWVSFYRCLHDFMLRILNFLRLVFWHFGVRFHDWSLCFLYCGARKPPFGLLAICTARRMSDCSCST